MTDLETDSLPARSHPCASCHQAVQFLPAKEQWCIASGVITISLAMRHVLCGLSTYRLNGHRKGEEHPACVPSQIWHVFYEN